MSTRNREALKALAAEYVLGTLRGRARRRFERLMHADFELQREVERWQDELYPAVLDALPDSAPPDHVWRSLARQTAASTPAPRRDTSRASLWDSVAFWRGFGALASAAAIGLLIYAGPRLWFDPPQSIADYVAVVNDQGSAPAWLVSVQAADRAVVVQALRPQELADNKSFELWLLPAQGQPPVSLGLIAPRDTLTLKLTADLAGQLATAAGLAVSLEPAGGSPTGQPTGPVLYQGALVRAG